MEATQKIRVTILADPLDNQYAGVHRFADSFITQLHQLEDENLAIEIVRMQAEPNRFPLFTETVIPMKSWIPFYRAWRIFFLIPRKVKRGNPSLVMELAHFGPFLLPHSIKRMTFIHDMTPILMPQYHRFLVWFLQKVFMRRILRRADILVTNSTYTKEDMVKYMPEVSDKTFPIHLGVDPIFGVKEDKGIVKSYGITAPYILYVGTIEPRKNLNALLLAFDKWKGSTGASHQLVFVGKKGWKTKKFDHAIQTHAFAHDIIECGYIPKEHLPFLYTHCTLFVYPSLYEGFGLPVIEAMACGAPCLLSHSSSLVEVGGEAATFFDLEDEDDLCTQLSELLNDDRRLEKMSRLSLHQAAKFSWKLFVDNWVALVKSLIG